MWLQSWERAKVKVKVKVKWYQRREPTKTDLYRVGSSGRDELPRVWEEVLKTFDAYLDCGLLEQGAARGCIAVAAATVISWHIHAKSGGYMFHVWPSGR